MNLSLDISSEISLNQQIKIQIKYLIFSGVLKPGTQIPSVREMSAFLKANRNTVSKAYKDLAEEGFLDIRQATGTFVADNIEFPKERQISKVIDLVKNDMEEARKLGFSSGEFMNIVQMICLHEKNSSMDVHALFVECNPFALEQYVKDLVEALSISVEGCLLSDLEQNKVSREYLRSFDFIVTTAGHYPRVLELVGDEVDIYGINIGPYLEVLEQLLNYPRDAKIGIICVSSRSGSEGLKQALLNLGIRNDSIVEGSATEEDIYHVAENVDIIVASKFALKASEEAFKKVDKRIIEYENVLSEASIEILNKVIERILSKKDISVGTHRGEETSGDTLPF